MILGNLLVIVFSRDYIRDVAVFYDSQKFIIDIQIMQNARKKYFLYLIPLQDFHKTRDMIFLRMAQRQQINISLPPWHILAEFIYYRIVRAPVDNNIFI